MKEWKAILKEFYSDYEQLNTLFGNKIRANAEVVRENNKWKVIIHGNSLLKEHQEYYKFVDVNLEEKLNWANSQLLNWHQVKQINECVWQFPKKVDALKFQTLFNLKWSE